MLQFVVERGGPMLGTAILELYRRYPVTSGTYDERLDEIMASRAIRELR